ncbi:MAG: hypothetical protein DCF28_14245, partial [Alphaproteobacteria bacterium]
MRLVGCDLTAGRAGTGSATPVGASITGACIRGFAGSWAGRDEGATAGAPAATGAAGRGAM